ncbi:MAG TPA: hypothetical protein PKD59_07615 [Miltoncostaeaceae bacterium]|nr:hypothetical protein [Miltoncostaeaceae bacterium]
MTSSTHDESDREETGRDPGHGHHHWMMIACCIPMLVIAISLVATGVVGSGFIIAAIVCVMMMALMMGAMSRGGDGPTSR